MNIYNQYFKAQKLFQMNFLLLLFFIIFNPTYLFSSSSITGEIIIEIEGLRNSKGTVKIGVYDKKERFPKDGGSLLNLTGNIVNGKCIIEVKNLAKGDYSFALLHDENNNDEMDYNWIGIPKEGFGFSRNPSTGLTAPSFNETKVTFDGSKKHISIKVKYM
jgi:uncharacterized protein (DUF2141 family)